MITIKAESYFGCIDELEPLLYDMYLEVEGHQEKFPLDPDWERYEFMYDADMLRIHVARDEGKMVGFMVSMITPHSHHKDVIFASSDVFYIIPTHREGHGGLAGNLLFQAEMDLKENCNVQRMVLGMKIKHEFRKLAKYCGFEPIEELWEKVL